MRPGRLETRSLRPAWWRTFVVALAAAALSLSAGCGFRVRGDTELPFQSMAISGGEGSPFVIELKRKFRGNARVRLAERPEQADVTLFLVTNQNDKNILTLSGGGRVREFQLTQRVVFRVADRDGREWLPLSEINVRRDFSFNDSQALAKEGEERMLVADMQTDAIQQLLRRLGAARRPG